MVHFIVSRKPAKTIVTYRTRCGIESRTKGADMSAWGSEITCPRCLS